MNSNQNITNSLISSVSWKQKEDYRKELEGLKAKVKELHKKLGIKESDLKE